MSTPIQQLPQGAQPPSNAKLDEDPAVTDVIKEMQLEFAHPPVTSGTPHPTPVPVPTSHTPPPYMMATSVIPVPPAKEGWLHTDHAKRAAMVAVVAFLMLYPCDLSSLYQKVPGVARFASYDRFIRVALLAVVLYVLFWKLNI